jgi:hypothetical protein
MRTLLAAGLMLGMVSLTLAQDKKADPNGTWKWTSKIGKQERETTQKLKLDGDKLTGTMTSGGGKGKATDTKIEEGTFKDGRSRSPSPASSTR